MAKPAPKPGVEEIVPPPPPPSTMESTIPNPLGGPSGPRGPVFGSVRIRLVPRRAGASITLLREPPPEAFESGAIRIIDRDATYRGYISADGRANSNGLALEKHLAHVPADMRAAMQLSAAHGLF